MSQNNITNSEYGIDFVIFEQAYQLKQLGFDWKCNHIYKNKEHTFFHCLQDAYDNHNAFTKRLTDDLVVSAPTLYQAQKWLREKCKIFTSINIYFPNYKDDDYLFAKYGFVYIDRRNNRAIRIESDRNNQLFDTYEEALSAVISKALELMENGEQ